jgi:hypothetical protein
MIGAIQEFPLHSRFLCNFIYWFRRVGIDEGHKYKNRSSISIMYKASSKIDKKSYGLIDTGESGSHVRWLTLFVVTSSKNAPVMPLLPSRKTHTWVGRCSNQRRHPLDRLHYLHVHHVQGDLGSLSYADGSDDETMPREAGRRVSGTRPRKSHWLCLLTLPDTRAAWPRSARGRTHQGQVLFQARILRHRRPWSPEQTSLGGP